MAVKDMTVDDVVEFIDNMKVMDLAALVKKIEEKYGVSSAAPVAVAAAPGAAEPVEEKTAFEVLLKSFAADKKIKVIKVIREITALGLKEAKDLVEGAPNQLKAEVTKEEAEAIKKKVEEVGGTVEIK